MYKIIIAPLPMMILFTGMRWLLRSPIGIKIWSGINSVSPLEKPGFRAHDNESKALDEKSKKTEQKSKQTPDSDLNDSNSSGDTDKFSKINQFELVKDRKKGSLEKESKKTGSNKQEESEDQSKLSQFQVGAPKRRPTYGHLKSGSSQNFTPNSSSELKFDGGNTMCSSPTSPRSGNKVMDQLESTGREGPSQHPTRWEKFKAAMGQPSFTKIVIGRCLIVLVTVGSIFLILKISTNSSGDSWPWGFWYVAALIFDQCIFQPITSLIQFSLLFRFIKNSMNKEWKNAPVTRFVIGKDIMTIVESKLSFDQ